MIQFGAEEHPPAALEFATNPLEIQLHTGLDMDRRLKPSLARLLEAACA